MRLIIFGATGSIGQHLIEQALGREHIVTAFTRDAAKRQSVNHTNLHFYEGDVLDPLAVEKSMKDKDAVLCALGAGRKGRVRSEGTKNIIQAMEKTGIKRLICQTTLGAGDSRSNLNFFWKYIMFGMLLKEAYADHEVQENVIRQSKLDWILVRPAAFTDGKRTGNYQHGFGPDAKKLALKISRADVADFMLKQLESDQYLRKAAGLSYRSE